MLIGESTNRILQNHCYESGGKIIAQMKNGIIGLRAQGPVSECKMIEWNEKVEIEMAIIAINSDPEFKRYIEYNKELIKKTYVDDSLRVCLAWPPGTILDLENMKLYIDEKQKEKDIEENDPAKRTKEINLRIANKIDKTLLFAIDIPSEFEDGKMPFLDMKIHMD